MYLVAFSANAGNYNYKQNKLKFCLSKTNEHKWSDNMCRRLRLSLSNVKRKHFARLSLGFRFTTAIKPFLSTATFAGPLKPSPDLLDRGLQGILGPSGYSQLCQIVNTVQCSYFRAGVCPSLEEIFKWSRILTQLTLNRRKTIRLSSYCSRELPLRRHLWRKDGLPVSVMLLNVLKSKVSKALSSIITTGRAGELGATSTHM